MHSSALPDQFIKSWVFAFVVGVVVIGGLQAFGVLSYDHVLTREAPVWGVLALACSVGPTLRYFGVLKAEVEQRWADYTIASLLGRVTGALVGSAFAWAIGVLGN